MIEDEFKVIAAIDNMTTEQLKQMLRFYVGQSFSLLRANQELSKKLIDIGWGR